MVWSDDVHVRDQPRRATTWPLRLRMAAGARGSAPRRARVSPRTARSRKHRRRSKMQHAIDLEAEPPPDLGWRDLRAHTCADRVRAAPAGSVVARENRRLGRSVFLERLLPGRKMTEPSAATSAG